VPIWTGFYAGINGGFGGESGLGFRDRLFTVASPSTVVSSFTGSADITGGFGGGQAGYNFQYGNFVYGIETDIQGSDLQGHGSAASISVGPAGVPVVGRFANADLRVDYFGTVRGRLGYAWGGVLLYATGGFAYGGVKESLRLTSSTATATTVTNIVSNNNTDTGWTAGGGVEFKISPSLSLKGEYQFISLGSHTTGTGLLTTTGLAPCDTAGSCGHNGNFKNVEFNTVRVGLNYYFNTPYQPLPLK
jgi:outer membrane immunogenic protein